MGLPPPWGVGVGVRVGVGVGVASAVHAAVMVMSLLTVSGKVTAVPPYRQPSNLWLVRVGGVGVVVI